MAQLRLKGLKLVSFDAFHTLFTPKHPTGYTYREFARKFKVAETSNCDSGLLHEKFLTSFAHFERAVPNYGRGKMRPRDWWRLVVQHTFESSRLEIRWDNFETMLSALINSFADKANYTLYPDALGLLQHLKLTKPHLKLVVISNMDDGLEPLLDSLGIANYFSYICSSYKLGAMKPDPYIFQFARAKVGLDDPSEALHVGDDFSRDYLGALQAGYHARLLRRGATDIPEACGENFITSLDQLKEQIA
ncbi:hypothetical protein L0F63_003259 [Massospora cicadina]|nr:hypothetical protein L0F63_003259 [Massospora cicadina]